MIATWWITAVIILPIMITAADQDTLTRYCTKFPEDLICKQVPQVYFLLFFFISAIYCLIWVMIIRSPLPPKSRHWALSRWCPTLLLWLRPSPRAPRARPRTHSPRLRQLQRPAQVNKVSLCQYKLHCRFSFMLGLSYLERKFKNRYIVIIIL